MMMRTRSDRQSLRCAMRCDRPAPRIFRQTVRCIQGIARSRIRNVEEV
jgi:hypothetical protein